MVGSGFEQKHDPLAGGEIEIEESAKAVDNRGATGDHPKAARKAPARLSVCISSQGQTDCILSKGIQKRLQRQPGWRGSCLTICDDRRLETSDAGLSENEGMKLSGHETDSIYRRYDIFSDDDLTESMGKVQEHLKKEAENRKVVRLNQRTA